MDDSSAISAYLDCTARDFLEDNPGSASPRSGPTGSVLHPRVPGVSAMPSAPHLFQDDFRTRHKGGVS